MEGAASSGIISYRASELQALCLVSKYISTIAIEHLYDEVDTIRYRYCITFVWYNQRVDEEISVLSLEGGRDCNTFGSSERAAVIGGQPRPSVWSCRNWAIFFPSTLKMPTAVVIFPQLQGRLSLSDPTRSVFKIYGQLTSSQDI